MTFRIVLTPSGATSNIGDDIWVFVDAMLAIDTLGDTTIAFTNCEPILH